MLSKKFSFAFALGLGTLLLSFQGVREGMEILLAPSQRIWIVEKCCFLQIFRNQGLSFSLFASSPLALPMALLSFGGVVLFFLAFRPSKGSTTFFWGSLLLMAGGMNNLGERIFHHAVTDYLGLQLPLIGALFINIPDLAIALGAFLCLLGHLFFGEDGKN